MTFDIELANLKLKLLNKNIIKIQKTLESLLGGREYYG